MTGMKKVYVVCHGLPGPKATDCVFVELEDEDGNPLRRDWTRAHEAADLWKLGPMYVFDDHRPFHGDDPPTLATRKAEESPEWEPLSVREARKRIREWEAAGQRKMEEQAREIDRLRETLAQLRDLLVPATPVTHVCVEADAVRAILDGE